MKITTVKWLGKSTEAYYENGMVYVWDIIARHYTTCHTLTANQCARVKRLANRDGDK